VLIVFPTEEPALTDSLPVLESEKLKDAGRVGFCPARAGESGHNDPINSVKRLKKLLRIVNVRPCGGLPVGMVIMGFTPFTGDPIAREVLNPLSVARPSGVA